jgi:hypothetical protein
MPAPLTSPNQSSRQPTVSPLQRASAPGLNLPTANGLAGLKPPTPRPFVLGRQQMRLLDYLRRQAEHWPSAHQLDLAVVLEAQVAELRAGGSEL